MTRHGLKAAAMAAMLLGACGGPDLVTQTPDAIDTHEAQALTTSSGAAALVLILAAPALQNPAGAAASRAYAKPDVAGDSSPDPIPARPGSGTTAHDCDSTSASADAAQPGSVRQR